MTVSLRAIQTEKVPPVWEDTFLFCSVYGLHSTWKIP